MGIIFSAALSHIIINKDILIEEKVQFLNCKLDNLEIGFLNIYAPNRRKERAQFWDRINAQLPTRSSWIVTGYFNMVKNEEDRSGNKKLIRGEKQEAWNNFIFKHGLEDANRSDNFDAHNSLNYTRTNKRDKELLMARLTKLT